MGYYTGMSGNIDMDNAGFKEIRFKGKTVQPDGSSTSRNYTGIMWVGENEDGTPKEKYLDFKDIDFTHKLSEPVPIPRKPEGFTGWIDSEGEEINV